MEIQYIGEHLLPGKLGNFFIILSFVSSLLATFSFYRGTAGRNYVSWLSLARTSIYIHSLAVIMIIGMLFYILLNHYYEYYYVWQHSNNSMPMRYIFSCFWEGQEGSFLLWIFWNVVLGIFLLRQLKGQKNTDGFHWEAPVMTIYSSVQAFLTSMLLGIYIGDFHIGSNPFTILLREHPDFFSDPLFQQSHYLAQLDGRGLNPLLQNYWMTIHPPTLFLGFALTLIPFCFALASLWKKQYTSWIPGTIPWAFTGVAVLGIGVLMGGAWAYEALSFGGFWAWDPVENASLVPWLTLVGAGHIMIVQKKKKVATGILFFLTLISFLLVLYSTFLTRSGILGEASVHSFTDLGMSGQLLLYLLFYLVLSILLTVIRFRELPKSKNEDALYSREFWMFIGALVLIISAFQITATTSIPVVNKVFGTQWAPPVNAISHYNSWQVPIAVIIALVIALAIYLKYRDTQPRSLFRQLLMPMVISTGGTIVLAWFADILHLKNLLHLFLLFASLFVVLANTDYFIRILHGKIASAGAAFAHTGFGFILLGALISQSGQKNISSNATSIDISQIGKDYENKENSLLFIRDTVPMGDYFVTYRGKKQEGVNIFYEVEYLEQKADSSFERKFSLFPRVQINARMGNVPEPDTKHFLHKDIYTHVTYAELEERKSGGFNKPEIHKMAAGDTAFSSNAIIILESFDNKIDRKALGLNDSDLAVGAHLMVKDAQGTIFTALPVFVLRQNMVFQVFDDVSELGLRFTFEKIYPLEKKIDLAVYESTTPAQKEFIIMKAVIFPGINILWIGCLIFLLGTILSVWQRVRRSVSS